MKPNRARLDPPPFRSCLAPPRRPGNHRPPALDMEPIIEDEASGMEEIGRRRPARLCSAEQEDTRPIVILPVIAVCAVLALALITFGVIHYLWH